MSDSEEITSKSKNENKTKSNPLDDKYPTKRGFAGNFYNYFALFLSLIFLNMKATGRENCPDSNKYIITSNHQSYIDGLYIANFLPRGHFKHMCCLAASDLEDKHGWIGRVIMRVGRGIAVDRYGNPVRGLIKAKREVDKGNICLVFPEGSRTATGRLTTFKDGACYLAIKSNVPLVPTYVTGLYELWPRSKKYPQPFKGFLKRKKIRIVYGKPIYGKDFDNDPHKMTDYVYNWTLEMDNKYNDAEVLDKALFKKK
ncbi:MAG: 1-acyl-sn-glycerol-3-phosphate acyltransferase [Clostridia bacterium]|nr:1-acyl-sn-glycerol-3-phosphate acyltransferase [Clostridia bacterium]